VSTTSGGGVDPRGTEEKGGEEPRGQSKGWFPIVKGE